MEYEIQIKEGHLDTFGHVNNATYLELYEEARWEMIAGKGYTLERIQRDELGPVILDLKMSFKKELRNRDWIVVQTKLKEHRNKLVAVIEQTMINKAGDICSEIELAIGLFDMKKRKLVLPTKEWLAAIGG